ncbi:helix-turn-helix transcriptional regulator [Demequina zhanjiangensis]|uniref:Helix-turn-helix domain-containing protein n=1 Tax=Demequina zhanjiangensis TaxID=3051659 RepID=A0ABT8G4Z9_9MICO|nr:helix-turn-helix transcriptional regulator [Demequina sp. SYSU T00b26]MDN4474220.1 helix-turn-helix domain-containing protein [Demequina sp. SYSU T00b26]
MADLTTLGRRVRHFRTAAGLTLDQLGADVGIAASQLSLIENGRREPRLSQLGEIAARLDVAVADLLDESPPDERSGLEIELERAQKSPAYRELGLPELRPSRTMADDTLQTLVGLHRELDRRARQAVATPEEARRANTRQRRWMRERDNHLPEIERVADEAVAAVGHSTGALTHRSVAEMAERLGLTIVHVDDLPHSARSVLDPDRGRIYIPPASIPGGHGLRSLALQAMAHVILEHEAPTDYADFLRQRLEASYYAAACLMPQAPSVEFLQKAKNERRIAIEDFRDAFGVTHEAAALRFTNLATSHLGIRLHFLRVTGDGAVEKAYENDGLPLPVDVTGSTEGEIVCRYWSARQAFARTTRTTEYYQYTDTPAGTFFEATQTGAGSPGDYSITLGVPYAESKWFRGRETTNRAVSRCPDLSCCRAPDSDHAARWGGRAWASARVHTHTFSPLPHGTYPGVDDRELYEFLASHVDDD